MRGHVTKLALSSVGSSTVKAQTRSQSNFITCQAYVTDFTIWMCQMISGQKHKVTDSYNLWGWLRMHLADSVGNQLSLQTLVTRPMLDRTYVIVRFTHIFEERSVKNRKICMNGAGFIYLSDLLFVCIYLLMFCVYK